MAIPDTVKDQIKDALPLPGFFQSLGQRLRKSGPKSFRGTCPFEPGSRNPSKFVVRDDYFRCMACGEHGDIFNWFQKTEHLSFPAAIERAAGLAGISLAPYQRGADTQTVDPREEAVATLLATLAELAQVTAAALPPEAQRLDDIDLAPLIRSGEVGYLPSLEQLRAKLDRLGIAPSARTDAGVTDAALASLAERWVIWARRRTRLIGARPIDAAGPVIGDRGASTRAWITAPGADSTLRSQTPLRVAMDDRTYLTLRSLGENAVYRPMSPETVHPRRTFRALEHREEPPVLLVRPDAEARKRAFPDALRFVATNPRTRVAEFDPLPGVLADAGARRDALARLYARAGTVFDWQAQLFAQHDAFATPDGRARAAAKLGRVVRVTTGAVEREAFRLEVQALTGHRLEPAAPPAAKPDSAKRARPSTQ